MKKIHTPVFLSFLSFLSLLSSSPQFSSSISFHQLITINHGLHLRLIQTMCLHLSRSTLLRKPSPLIITFASNIFNTSTWKGFPWLAGGVL